MEKTRKGTIGKWAGAVALALVAALLLTLPGTAQPEEDGEILPSVLQCAVERRDMERTLRSGGALSGGEASSVTVPSGVKITELLAHNGDMVEKGDALAAVDRVSVMSAVRETQQTLEDIRESMNALAVTPGPPTVDENGKVCVDGRELSGDAYGDYAEYMTLAEQHRNCEETLLELFRLYYNGAVTAPEAGLVDGLDRSVVQSLASSASSARVTLLASNTPYGDDGESYLSFVGVVDSVVDGAMEMRMNPNPLAIGDFADLSAVDASLDAMTARGTYPGGAPMFARQGEEWSAAEGAESGDILLFTYDAGGSIVWVVKLGRAADWDPTPSPSPSPIPGETPGEGEAGQGGAGGQSGAGGWSGSPGNGAGNGAGSGSQQSGQQSDTAADTVLCTVVPVGEMSVAMAIDEQDIGELHEGMTALLTVDALPGRSFTGTVTSLSKFGSNNGGSSKFVVTLTLPYAEGMLPGMNVSGTFVLERRENVLVLPVAALTDEGKSTVAYTGYEEKTGEFTGAVRVSVGWSDGEWAEILSGLEEGQEVWYEYYDQLVLSTEAKGPTPPWG